MEARCLFGKTIRATLQKIPHNLQATRLDSKIIIAFSQCRENYRNSIVGNLWKPVDFRLKQFLKSRFFDVKKQPYFSNKRFASLTKSDKIVIITAFNTLFSKKICESIMNKKDKRAAKKHRKNIQRMKAKRKASLEKAKNKPQQESAS